MNRYNGHTTVKRAAGGPGRAARDALPTRPVSNGTAILIREARRRDAAVVAALLAELGYPCTGDDAAERLRKLGAADKVFLATDGEGGAVLGLAATHLLPMLHTGDLWCRMTALVVTENQRRKGVGAALLAHIEGFATAAGATWLELTCGERRRAAHRFYARNGFSEHPRRYLKLLGESPD